jgi:hypothetical protein
MDSVLFYSSAIILTLLVVDYIEIWHLGSKTKIQEQDAYLQAHKKRDEMT